MWFVYILSSTKTNSYYVGTTNNLTKRLNQHNKGKGAKFTRMYKNSWKCVYYYEYKNRSEACCEESRLKKMTHLQKQIIVEGNNGIKS